MNIALITALLTAAISIAGWVVNYVFTGLANRNRDKTAAQLQHVERQLAEFYGPLAFLVLEGQESQEDLHAAIGRSHGFDEEHLELSEEELKIWLFFVENKWFPKDEKIKELLTTKTHLVEGEQIPESFYAFLAHYNSWWLEHERWKKEQVRYSFHSRIRWPEDFDKHVLGTFEALKKKHALLLGKSLGSKGVTHPSQADYSTASEWRRQYYRQLQRASGSAATSSAPGSAPGQPGGDNITGSKKIR